MNHEPMLWDIAFLTANGTTFRHAFVSASSLVAALAKLCSVLLATRKLSPSNDMKSMKIIFDVLDADS